MTEAGKVVGKEMDAVEEGKGVAARREEDLAQKHTEETTALASSKAGKRL